MSLLENRSVGQQFLAEESHELHIELIPPIVTDEWHRWGSMTFRTMTREEFAAKYWCPNKDSA